MVITNGVISTSGVTVHYGGEIDQSGGSILSSGAVDVSGDLVGPNPGHWEYANYRLSGGAITSPCMYMAVATMMQSGGTNITASLAVNSADYNLYGGALITDYTSINTSAIHASTFYVGGSGLHYVARQLTIARGYSDYYGRSVVYDLSGGMLMASNIVIASRSVFCHSGGSIIVSGTLSLADCTFQAGPGAQELGQLELSLPSGGRAVMYMPQSSCVLHFKDSSKITWSSNATLVIDGWSNSIGGSGSTRIVFGSNATALTCSQLAQINFRNPRGLPARTYSAQMLSNGELVPQALFFKAERSFVALNWYGPFVLQSATNAAGPYTDIPSAVSPYVAKFAKSPQQFFRLKHDPFSSRRAPFTRNAE